MQTLAGMKSISIKLIQPIQACFGFLREAIDILMVFHTQT
jgi:hypothetical protein